MQAPRITYTIREGSVEEKTEETELLEKLQALDVRPLPDDRRLPGDRTTGGHRTFVTSATEPKSRKLPEVRELLEVRSLPSHRTSGVQRTTGTCLRTVFGPEAHVSLSPLTYPLVALDYINSSTSTILVLANVIAHFRLELCSSMWFYSYE